MQKSSNRPTKNLLSFFDKSKMRTWKKAIKENTKAIKAKYDRINKERKVNRKRNEERRKSQTEYDKTVTATENKADIQKRKAYDEFKKSKHTKKDTDKVLKKFKRINESCEKRKDNALKRKKKKDNNADDIRDLKLSVIKAKYVKSFSGTTAKKLSIVGTGGIFIVKWIIAELPRFQKIANAMDNVIHNLTAGRDWVSLLILPILFLFVLAINSLICSNDVHECVSGAVSVFLANMLVRATDQNPILVGKVNLGNVQYIATFVGVYLLVLAAFSATTYVPIRTVITTRINNIKNEARVFDLTYKDLLTQGNSYEDKRTHYNSVALAKISGPIFFFICLGIAIFSFIVTIIWMVLINFLPSCSYTASIVFVLFIPSFINAFEKYSRNINPDNAENKVDEAINKHKKDVANKAIETIKNNNKPEIKVQTFEDYLKQIHNFTRQIGKKEFWIKLFKNFLNPRYLFTR